ncbi:hypothetical protein E5D57_011194 [Metarhizium anisopliae]|nr:hypothetical protein E5D57_011194 [Metarhizium anisopliae]
MVKSAFMKPGQIRYACWEQERAGAEVTEFSQVRQRERVREREREGYFELADLQQRPEDLLI